MNYYGNLYGRVNGEYFETGKTAEDFEALERRLQQLLNASADYLQAKKNKQRTAAPDTIRAERKAEEKLSSLVKKLQADKLENKRDNQNELF